MDDSSTTVVPCPGCVTPMKVISVRSGYGYEHKIEICQPCGLIYFEGPETYALPASASAVLLQHFRGKQSASHEAPATLYCPRCNVAMKEIALKLPNHTYHQRQCEECKAVAIAAAGGIYGGETLKVVGASFPGALLGILVGVRLRPHISDIGIRRLSALLLVATSVIAMATAGSVLF